MEFYTNIFDLSFVVLTQFAKIIVPILSIYFCFDFIGGLLFGKK